jgi:hypothetical protein
MSTVSPASTLASAIAFAENGFGNPGTIPSIANNPGDLEVGDIGNGTINGVTIFSSLQDGWDALTNQANNILNGASNNYSPDETISAFGSTYSGGDPAFASNVSSILDVSPNSSLSGLTTDPDEQPQGPVPQTSSSSATPSTASSVGQELQQLLPYLGAYAGIPMSGGDSNSIISAVISSRVIYIVIGLILIAAGLFSFDSTKTVIQTVGKHAAKGAELLA